MEVPRLGVELELQPPAYTTATATQDPSHAWDQHHSSGNDGSSTHWVKPGIEPASLRMLVRFVSAEPRRELQNSVVLRSSADTDWKLLCLPYHYWETEEVNEVIVFLQNLKDLENANNFKFAVQYVYKIHLAYISKVNYLLGLQRKKWLSLLKVVKPILIA